MSTHEPQLLGRRSECAALDQLVASVREGLSRALVLRGEPGVGKSVLLEYLVRRASGCGIARAAGRQSEMELAFAGLHQLCAPFSTGSNASPIHSATRSAPRSALSEGDAPDRFLVGMAVLTLLTDVADGPAAPLRRRRCAVVGRGVGAGAGVRGAAISARSRCGLVLPCASRPARDCSRACRSWSRRASTTVTRRRCWMRSSRVRSTSGCATGSSPRRTVIRWRCLAARGRTPSSWRAASACRPGCPFRRGSSRRFQGVSQSSRRDPAPPPCRGGRAGGRSAPGVEGGRRAGDRGRRRRRGDGGGPGRARCPGALPPSAGAVGRVRGGRPGRPAARPRSPRRGHRRRDRSRSPRMAPRTGQIRTRRNVASRAGALGEPGRGARGDGGRGRLSRTRRRADAGPQPPGTACPGRGAGQAPGRRARCGAAPAGDGGGGAAGRARAGASTAAACADHVRDHTGPRRSPLLLAAAKRLEPLDAGLAHATYLEAFAAAFVADRLAVGGDAREVAAAVLAADWGPLRLPRRAV